MEKKPVFEDSKLGFIHWCVCINKKTPSASLHRFISVDIEEPTNVEEFIEEIKQNK